MIMLYRANTLQGYRLRSLDGEIGKVEGFYFDDRHWTVRYLVADTGSWLLDQQVLISPHAVAKVDEASRCITIDLTRKQIADSPSLNDGTPVSRRFETIYYEYYGWQRYWNVAYPLTTPTLENAPRSHVRQEPTQGGETADSDLRGTRDVRGHHIQALDREIGHVDDFILDSETWAIRYLVIDTRKWWPGKKILISPQWIDRVNWSESKVFVDLRGETIRKSPEYTDESLLDRDFEAALHDYYSRQGYWVDEQDDKKHPSSK